MNQCTDCVEETGHLIRSGCDALLEWCEFKDILSTGREGMDDGDKTT